MTNDSLISRRCAIRAGAWSAPVLVLAMATPIAAVSGVVDSGFNFLRVYNFSIWNDSHAGGRGPIGVDSTIGYAWNSEGAAVLQVPWEVTFSHEGEHVHTEAGTLTIAKDSSGRIEFQFPGAGQNLSPGEYTVRLIIADTDLIETRHLSL